ncbi:glycosyltransferase family 2 protein [bacterium]|nr:MAG: glycosyltransferase family 2 protein [bacterium]
MISLSIGIPSYNRPQQLTRLINSILNQKEDFEFSIEILIGDDSKINNKFVVDELMLDLLPNIRIIYEHHIPGKGQNNNVGSLIFKATGKYFCLMHDDDFFLEGAISKLLNQAIKNQDCIVFGKQVTYNNIYNYTASDKINSDFKRDGRFTGKQKDSIAMAMLQQCPNDGYILLTEHAKAIGSRLEDEIGTACDFDFALRATVEHHLGFYFINEYTTAYNISDDSVTSSFQNNAGERKLKILYEFNTNVTHPEVFHQVLKTDLSMVISHYIIVKDYTEAKKRLFSINNFFKYLWYKPATYLQLLKIITNWSL